jgi:Peptidase_C39 like family
VKKELNVAFAKQEHDKSCWACCTRLLVNYYQRQEVYKTDDDIAQTLSLKADNYQDIRKVLEASSCFNGIDDTDVVPSFDVIKQQINAGRPLVECVSGTAVSPGGNVIGGHYVLIVGYNDADQNICVIDPDELSMGKAWVLYDKKNYNATYDVLYWGVPYYTKAPH